MADATELHRLTALSYDVTVTEKAGLFYVYVPELSIVACDSELQQAYEKLREEKKQYFTRMNELGIADQVPLPDARRRRVALVAGLVDFELKAVVIGVVALGLLLAITPFLDAFVVKRLADAFGIGGDL